MFLGVCGHVELVVDEFDQIIGSLLLNKRLACDQSLLQGLKVVDLVQIVLEVVEVKSIIDRVLDCFQLVSGRD